MQNTRKSRTIRMLRHAREDLLQKEVSATCITPFFVAATFTDPCIFSVQNFSVAREPERRNYVFNSEVTLL